MQEEVPLGNPDILICSVGTEIFFEKPGSEGTEPQPDKKWIQLLDQGWNRQAALDAAAQLQELKPQVQQTLHVVHVFCAGQCPKCERNQTGMGHGMFVSEAIDAAVHMHDIQV